nr:MAG: protein of unknown function DUF3310 [Bacteriophage sp.]
MNDTVNHPAHYANRNIGYECIDLARHQTFCVGNTIKYLWRYKNKGTPTEDLKKALWYARLAKKDLEPVFTEVGDCESILYLLVDSTAGNERSAWVGLTLNDWQRTVEALDEMIKEEENDAQAK